MLKRNQPSRSSGGSGSSSREPLLPNGSGSTLYGSLGPGPQSNPHDEIIAVDSVSVSYGSSRSPSPPFPVDSQQGITEIEKHCLFQKIILYKCCLPGSARRGHAI